MTSFVASRKNHYLCRRCYQPLDPNLQRAGSPDWRLDPSGDLRCSRGGAVMGDGFQRNYLFERIYRPLDPQLAACNIPRLACGPKWRSRLLTRRCCDRWWLSEKPQTDFLCSSSRWGFNRSKEAIDCRIPISGMPDSQIGVLTQVEISVTGPRRGAVVLGGVIGQRPLTTTTCSSLTEV